MTLSQIGMSQTYLAFGIDNPVGIWRDLILIDMKIGKLPKYIKIRYFVNKFTIEHTEFTLSQLLCFFRVARISPLFYGRIVSNKAK